MAAIAPAGAQGRSDVIQIGVDSANPPFMSGTSTVARGLYPSLLAAVFSEMGEPVMIAALPWKRVLLGIDEGKVGAAGMYRTAARERIYDFSEPLFVERIGVYYNSRHPVVFKSIKDLHGLRIGVITGWSYGDEFDRARSEGKFSVESVPSDLQNLGKLERGRIDVALLIIDAAASLMNAEQSQHLLRGEKVLIENPTYLAFNRRDRRTGLLSKFNAAMAELRANGVYAKIASRELAAGSN